MAKSRLPGKGGLDMPAVSTIAGIVVAGAILEDLALIAGGYFLGNKRRKKHYGPKTIEIKFLDKEQ